MFGLLLEFKSTRLSELTERTMENTNCIAMQHLQFPWLLRLSVDKQDKWPQMEIKNCLNLLFDNTCECGRQHDTCTVWQCIIQHCKKQLVTSHMHGMHQAEQDKTLCKNSCRSFELLENVHAFVSLQNDRAVCLVFNSNETFCCERDTSCAKLFFFYTTGHPHSWMVLSPFCQTQQQNITSASACQMTLFMELTPFKETVCVASTLLLCTLSL